MSFLSKLKYLHKKTAPFISGPALLPFTSTMTTQSSKNKKAIRLAYSESDTFYSKLDDALTERCKISIYFKEGKLSENSKLFKYMSHCDGWPQVKNDLLRVSKKPPTIIYDNDHILQRSYKRRHYIYNYCRNQCSFCYLPMQRLQH